MRTLQIVNKLNELLYLSKSDKIIYWDREQKLFYITQSYFEYVYRTDNLIDLIIELGNKYLPTLEQ